MRLAGAQYRCYSRGQSNDKISFAGNGGGAGVMGPKLLVCLLRMNCETRKLPSSIKTASGTGRLGWRGFRHDLVFPETSGIWSDVKCKK